jgi:hypothetical protein
MPEGFDILSIFPAWSRIYANILLAAVLTVVIVAGGYQRLRKWRAENEGTTMGRAAIDKISEQLAAAIALLNTISLRGHETNKHLIKLLAHEEDKKHRAELAEVKREAFQRGQLAQAEQAKQSVDRVAQVLRDKTLRDDNNGNGGG